MRFTKAHGLGNDFIIMDDRANAVKANAALAKRLCHRRTGVGADGLILVRPSETCDARMVIFNSDGSEAEMCGNGVRCFAKYVFDKGIVNKESFSVETLAGPMVISVSVENGVATAARVDMGVPESRRPFIPMQGEGECRLEKLTVLGREFTFSTILLGVPHTVVFVDEIPPYEELCRYGAAIETLPLFPRKTNVNFTRVMDDKNLEVRTWERGCGATLACGTGSSSAAVCAAMAGFTGRRVRVHLELGALDIDQEQNGHVFMTGPAAFAYEGEVEV